MTEVVTRQKIKEGIELERGVLIVQPGGRRTREKIREGKINIRKVGEKCEEFKQRPVAEQMMNKPSCRVQDELCNITAPMGLKQLKLLKGAYCMWSIAFPLFAFQLQFFLIAAASSHIKLQCRQVERCSHKSHNMAFMFCPSMVHICSCCVIVLQHSWL